MRTSRCGQTGLSGAPRVSGKPLTAVDKAPDIICPTVGQVRQDLPSDQDKQKTQDNLLPYF